MYCASPMSLNSFAMYRSNARTYIIHIGSATDTYMMHEWVEKLGNLRAPPRVGMQLLFLLHVMLLRSTV